MNNNIWKELPEELVYKIFFSINLIPSILFINKFWYKEYRTKNKIAKYKSKEYLSKFLINYACLECGQVDNEEFIEECNKDLSNIKKIYLTTQNQNKQYISQYLPNNKKLFNEKINKIKEKSLHINFKYLEQLEFLSLLNSNYILKSIPKDFSYLYNIKVLNLFFTNDIEYIPDFSNLYKLTDLLIEAFGYSLLLNDENMNNIGKLKNLPFLILCDIRFNNLDFSGFNGNNNSILDDPNIKYKNIYFSSVIRELQERFGLIKYNPDYIHSYLPEF